MAKLLLTIATLIFFPCLAQADLKVDWWVTVQTGGLNSSTNTRGAASYQVFSNVGQTVVGKAINSNTYTLFAGYVPKYTRQTGQPNTPLNLKATAVSSTQITLAWQDVANIETGFELERKIPDGDFSHLVLLGPKVETYQDNYRLSSNQTYIYRVRACNEYGSSSWSNLATSTTKQAERGFTPYHNLFNPDKQETVQIKYVLSQSANVEIKIYSLTGRLVKKLEDEEKSTGEYWLNWDGRDENNRIVASGTYIIYFKAGDFKNTEKIIVIK